jgi:predicted AlkP superfamily pyrophosphatase or phosphodiesterase
MYIQGIYTETTDVYGHYTGPNSPELNAKLVAMDGVEYASP